VTVKKSDLQFNVCEIRYVNENVAGRPLSSMDTIPADRATVPRDIQESLSASKTWRSANMTTACSHTRMRGTSIQHGLSETLRQRGFEDALNIDRDSFNELHPHYIRAQSYVHSLLHDLIFPETWKEEKERNKSPRDQAAEARESKFVERYRKTTGDAIRSIQRVERQVKERPPATSENRPSNSRSVEERSK